MNSKVPLRQKRNRVWRSYTGGKLIDLWQKASDPMDGDMPEEWVASTVVARGNGRPPHEGLSLVELQDGGTAYLKDLIESDKEAFLGKRIAQRYGDTALLVKMLDSCERLTIQVHPDKQFARRFLHSEFGKTEGWYVLGGREIDQQESYVLFGFKEGVTREKWADFFRRQDIDGMIDSLHKIPVKPGDVFIIHGGVPHAIGSGCFLLEIQEPTDYTMRVEKTTPAGLSLDEMLIHQGVGEERMLDCFHYEALSYEETLKRWKPVPKVVSETSEYTLRALIDERHCDCFSLSELTVRANAETYANGDFYVAIVYEGGGEVMASDYRMPVCAGNELFIPADAPVLNWMATSSSLKILLCYPPM